MLRRVEFETVWQGDAVSSTDKRICQISPAHFALTTANTYSSEVDRWKSCRVVFLTRFEDSNVKFLYTSRAMMPYYSDLPCDT